MSPKLANTDILTRTISGGVFVAVIVAATLVSPWTFAALSTVIAAGCLWEFYRLAAGAGAEPQKWFGTILGVTLMPILAFALELGWVVPVAVTLFIPLLLATTFIIELYRKREKPLLDIAATLMGVIYVVVPLALLLFMRMANGDPYHTLFYFLILWANDTGAYLVGVAFGRHRLFERISPKKSWEGFFGGILFSVIVAAISAMTSGESFPGWIGFAVVVAVSGVLGDLVESMLKREVGVKDSGAMMPGHGGWLDRFDSLLLSVPFVLMYYLIIFR